MAILNYSTKIDPSKTAGEIQTILAKNGATKTMIDYDDGSPVALSFQVDSPFGLQSVRLPINVAGCLRAFRKDGIPKSFHTKEQAERTAWRNCKAWVEAQMAMIYAEQMTMAQVFLPMTMDNAGSTMYELFESKRLMLE